MMDSRLQTLKDWLLDRNPGLDTLDLNLDLLENQVVDSMGFVELILNIQQLSGVEIDMSEVDVDSLRSLGRIGEKYFASEEAGLT